MLLDFDVVYGALSKMRDKQSTQPEVIEGFPPTPMELLGDAATSYLLRVTPEYVLPPGSTAELLQHQQRLRHSLSGAATRFLEHADKLRTDPSSLQGRGAIHREKVYELLKEDATNFVDDLQGGAFLERVLERAQPIRDYIGDSYKLSDSPIKILRDSYSLLKGKRPWNDKSNFYDAMNAAAVATVLTSSTITAPILVTQSPSILSSNDFGIPELLPKQLMDPSFIVFNRPLFLLVFETLLSRTEHRYFSAADHAHQLMIDSEYFAGAIESLLRYCKEQEDKNTPIESLSKIPNAKWEMMLFSHETWSKRWWPLFAPMQLATKRDLVQAAELLKAQQPSTRHYLSSEIGTHEGMQTLLSRLKSAEPISDQIWGLIVEAKNAPETQSQIIRGALTNVLFAISWTHSSGELFAKTVIGSPPDSLDTLTLEGSHSLEINVIPTVLSSGAILRLISFRDLNVSPRRYLRLSWLHALPPADAIRRCWEVFNSLDESDETTAIVYFDSTIKRLPISKEWDGLFAADEIMDAQLVEYHRGFFRAFVDLEELDGIELHISLTISDSAATYPILDRIASTIELTSATMIPKKIAFSLLLECLRVVGAGPKEESR
ncbi:hypothetical protein [Bradyrhizobium sp.]|uniref:hypothetical protein n=1 Tax=Bradyrhizobium sp. TaxID=376 RepID=UPI002B89EBA5|nr:hypothetical protein [Bradyrhizobium sp.]HWX59269.1 hypothetical protein [Bradyrhizobium sp.]